MRYCFCENPLGDMVGTKCAECESETLDKIIAEQERRPTKRAVDVSNVRPCQYCVRNDGTVIRHATNASR